MSSPGGAYNAGTAHVNIKPKLANFATELRAQLKSVHVEHDVKVNADTSKFAAQVRAAMDTVADSHTLRLNADTVGFAAQVRSALDTLPDSHTIRLGADMDTSQARGQLEALVSDRATTIDVKTNAVQAGGEIDAAAERPRTATIDTNAITGQTGRELDRLTRKRRAVIKIEADSSGAQRAVITLGKRMQGLDRYQRRMALTAAGFTLIGTAAAGAIGPVSAFGGALIAASGTLATLPAVLGAAAAGIAGLGVGLSGVGKAFGAMGKTAGGAGGSAGNSMRDAGRAVEKAQRGVESANRGVRDAQEGIVDAEGAIGDAQERISDAQEGIADAQQGVSDAQETISDAYKDITRAERGVVEAQEDSRDAQEDLNRARADAVRELQDMNDQLNDAALSEEGAVLAVARAKQRLQETLQDSDSDQLDIAEADLGYRQAIDNLDDMRLANNRLAEDTATANRAGVEGSAGVVSAHEKVADAQQGEIDAADGLETAYRGLRDANRGMEDANRSLRDSHRGLGDAYEEAEDAQRGLRDAHEGLADAQQGVQDAQENLADAFEGVADAASGAAGDIDPFAAAMANLSKEAQEFVLAMKDLGPAWRDLKMATQDALFDGMAESVTSLANRQLPVLKDGLVGINAEINDGLRSSIGQFSSEIAAIDFRTFLTNSAGLFSGLASAAAPMSQIWMDLATVGSEYLPRMGDAIADVADSWSRSISSMRASGDLNDMINDGIAAFGRLKDFAGDVSGTLSGVFGAASAAGDPFLIKVERAFSSMNEWSNSIEGQNALVDFFSEASVALDSAMPALQAIGTLVTTGLVPIVESLVTGIAPGITDFAYQIRDTMLLGEGAFSAFGEAAGDVLTNFTDFIRLMEPLHSLVFNLAEAFLGLPTPILAVATAMAVFKKMGILSVIEKTTRGVGNLRDEMKAQQVAVEDASNANTVAQGKMGGFRGVMDNAATGVGRLRVAMDDQKISAEKAGNSLGRVAAGWRALETRSETITKMGDAFRGASANAQISGSMWVAVGKQMDGIGGNVRVAQGRMQKFGGVMQGVTAGAVSGMRSGVGGLSDFLGGPWGVAFAVAGVAVGVITSEVKRWNEHQEVSKQLASQSVDVYGEMFGAMKVGGDVAGVAADGISEMNGLLLEVADKGPGAFTPMAAGLRDIAGWFKGEGFQVGTDMYNQQKELSDQAKLAAEGIDDLGFSNEQLAAKVTGSTENWEMFIGSLRDGTPKQQAAAAEIQKLRDAHEQAKQKMDDLGPSGMYAAEVFDELAKTSGQAAGDANKLARAYQELSGSPVDATQAAADLTEEIQRNITAMGNFEGATINSLTGAVDTTTVAGADLHKALQGIGDTMRNSVEAGNDAGDEFLRSSDALEQMRISAGIGTLEWEALLDTMQMTPERMETIVEVKTDVAKTELVGISQELKNFVTGPYSTTVNISDQAAIDRLEGLGIRVENFDEKEGTADVHVSDQASIDKLNWWIKDGFPQIDTANPTATANMDDANLLLKVEAANLQIAGLGAARPNPLANMDISLLGAAQVDALTKVGLLDGQNPIPFADMNIQDLTEEQQTALGQVFDLSQETPTPLANMETKVLDEKVAYAHDEIAKVDEETPEPVLGIDISGFMDGLGNAIDRMSEFASKVKEVFTGDDTPSRSTQNDNTFASGGVIPKYATGGFLGEHSGYRLPTAGPGTDMVDGFMGVDTHGMPIARVDAGEWVINRKASKKYHRELQAINSGTYPTGGASQVDGLNAYASGGQVEQMEAYVRQFHPGAIPTGKAYSGLRFTDNGYHSTGQAADFSNGGDAGTPEMVNLARDIYKNHKERTLQLIHHPLNGFRNVLDGRDFDYGHSTNMDHRDHVHWATGVPVAYKPDVDLGLIGDAKFSVIPNGFGYQMAPYSGSEIGPRPANDRPRNEYKGVEVEELRRKQKRTKGYAAGGRVDYVPNEHSNRRAGVWSPNPTVTRDFDWVGGGVKSTSQLRLNPDRDLKHKHGAEVPGHATGGLVEQLMSMWGQPLFPQGQVAPQGVPNMHGLDELNLEGAGESVEPLADFRASPASDPNSYPGGAGSLPTTWGGLATHLATPIIEGQVTDALGVLGMPSTLPPAMTAYAEYQQAISAQRSITANTSDNSGIYSVSGGGGAKGISPDTGTYSAGFSLGLSPDQIVNDQLNARSVNYQHDPAGGAEQWRPMMMSAHDNQGFTFSDAKIDAYIRQIQSESTGNPSAVQNIVDENGTGESAGVGLFQFIPTTWAAYRDPTLPDDRRDPWAMTNAAVRYGEGKYGASLLDVIGHGHGWATGGSVFGAGGPTDDLIPAALSNGEFVTRTMSATVARPLLEAMNDSPALAAQLNQGFMQGSNAPTPASNAPVELHYHIETNNIDEGMRRAEMQANRQMAAMAVR